MKYLGIDYGTKKIGIAISDDDGSFAFPKAIVVAGSTALDQIIHILQVEKIGVIVIGQSIASNEAVNTITDQVQKFKTKLMHMTELPIFFEREDFSSVEAHRYQTKAGNRDDSAAAVILQRFLDKQSK